MIKGEEPQDVTLNRHFSAEARNIAKRHVLRVDPAIKRLYCKRCGALLPKLEMTDE